MRILLKNLVNIPGWHTHRKIVILESDDWGSIRMPSRTVYNNLLFNKININDSAFNRYDSLASEEDLSLLFKALLSVKDKNDQPAILTANTIVANPDFIKIREDKYQNYYYEPFPQTLERYPQHTRSFNLWKEGIEMGVFRPQFHGREHLNVIRWMKALRENKGLVRLAFDHQMYDLSVGNSLTENSFIDAYNLEEKSELIFQRQSLIEGLALFEELFGYKSISMIAPCYIWRSSINQVSYQFGIRAIQGGWYQFEPQYGKDHRFKKVFHYTGERNEFGQVYLVRNAHFEPSQNRDKDHISDVLRSAEIAFRWGKPLIIGTHRLNYIGFIDKPNRDRGLILLTELLERILDKWPDIEFMSTDKLVDIL